jgi:DNA-binding CsgD family transcriptional regulator
MAFTVTSWSPSAAPSDSPLFAPGAPVAQAEADTIWRELASGRWQVLAAIDANGRRHLAIVPAAPKPAIHWRALGARQRYVLALVARGYAQKVIAMKLGMAASTVSAAFQSARRRLGFPSPSDLVRACQGAGEALAEAPEAENLARGGSMRCAVAVAPPAPTYAGSEASLSLSPPRAFAPGRARSVNRGRAR